MRASSIRAADTTKGAPMTMPFGLGNNKPTYQIGLDYDAGGNQIKVILTNIEYALLVYTAAVDIPNLVRETADALEEARSEARVMIFRIRKG